MTHLYLIRHGEAFANVEPILGGMKGDIGLTPLGVSQAKALHDRLAATGEIIADVLIASPLARAHQTAEIIQTALGVALVTDPEVEELRLGEADGMRVPEFRAKFGLPDFRADPYRPIAPSGENWGGFVLRVGAAMHRIVHEHAGKTIVIVCHGGVIDASFLIFMGLHTLTIPGIEFWTHNTSITEWMHISQENEPPRWRLLRYNDDAHLREVGRNEHVRWDDVPPAEPESDHPAVPLPIEGE